MAVKKDDLITVNDLTSYIFGQCEAYLSHHQDLNSDEYRYTVDGKDKIRYNTDNGKGNIDNATWHSDKNSGCFEWANTSKSNILSDISTKCNTFSELKRRQIIYAYDVINLVSECFYKTHRIAKQTFKYYLNATESSTHEKEGYGFLEDYYEDLDTYKINTRYCFSDNGIESGKVIYASSVINAIKSIYDYNYYYEEIFDHGTRNSQNINTFYVLTTISSPSSKEEAENIVNTWQLIHGTLTGVSDYTKEYRSKWVSVRKNGGDNSLLFLGATKKKYYSLKLEHPSDVSPRQKVHTNH